MLEKRAYEDGCLEIVVGYHSNNVRDGTRSVSATMNVRGAMNCVNTRVVLGGYGDPELQWMKEVRAKNFTHPQHQIILANIDQI